MYRRRDWRDRARRGVARSMRDTRHAPHHARLGPSRPSGTVLKLFREENFRRCLLPFTFTGEIGLQIIFVHARYQLIKIVNTLNVIIAHLESLSVVTRLLNIKM